MTTRREGEGFIELNEDEIRDFADAAKAELAAPDQEPGNEAPGEPETTTIEDAPEVVEETEDRSESADGTESESDESVKEDAENEAPRNDEMSGEKNREFFEAEINSAHKAIESLREKASELRTERTALLNERISLGKDIEAKKEIQKKIASVDRKLKRNELSINKEAANEAAAREKLNEFLAKKETGEIASTETKEKKSSQEDQESPSGFPTFETTNPALKDQLYTLLEEARKNVGADPDKFQTVSPKDLYKFTILKGGLHNWKKTGVWSVDVGPLYKAMKKKYPIYDSAFEEAVEEITTFMETHRDDKEDPRLSQIRVDRGREKEKKETDRQADMTEDQKLAEKREAARIERRKEYEKKKENEARAPGEFRRVSADKKLELLRDALEKADKRTGDARMIPEKEKKAGEETAAPEETVAAVAPEETSAPEKPKSLREKISSGFSKVAEKLGIKSTGSENVLEAKKGGIGFIKTETGTLLLKNEGWGAGKKLKALIKGVENNLKEQEATMTPVEKTEREFVLIGLKTIKKKVELSKFSLMLAIEKEKGVFPDKQKLINRAFESITNLLEGANFEA